MARVIVLGSINVDLEVRVPRHPRVGEKVIGESLSRFAGGKGANQAVAARARGVEVFMVGAVGDDDAGRASLNRLYSRGLRLLVDRVPNTPTGHALITTDGGSNEIVVISGANLKLGSRPLDPIKGLGADDLLLTQLESPVDKVASASRFAAERGVRVMINLAPWAELPADVVELADPLVIPASDLPTLRQGGAVPRSLVVLHGKEGLAWDDEFYPASLVPDSDVVDTVGASDALIGTLAAAIAMGEDRATSVQLAQEAAAENVRHFGAQPDPRL